MRSVIRVLSAAVNVSDLDVAGAIAWFRRHPIADLSRKTPDQLVSDGEAEAVVRYLDSISAGFTG